MRPVSSRSSVNKSQSNPRDWANELLKHLAEDPEKIQEAYFLIENPHFSSRPVSIKKFVTGPEYLNTPEAWPEVQKILEELFDISTEGERLSRFTEFVFDAGIGSGKSFIVSCMFSYAVYWLLCLTSPQQYLGLAPKSTICLINTSTSGNQAKKVVFGNIKQRIDNSPWFQKFAMPDPNVKSELRFPKDIVIFPGSSSETAPIGYNVFMANVDEASFFVSTDYKDKASEVFDALERRINSRFGDKGLIAVTSSPRYIDDFTEKKYLESRSVEGILGFKRATWEMRPDDIEAVAKGYYFEIEKPGSKELVKIPLKYKKAFTKNPRKAWRDLGAVASLVLEAYFTDEEILKIEAMIKNSKLPFPIKEGALNLSEMRPLPNTPYRIHIDLGIVRDCCGFGMAHSENGEKVTLDILLRIASAKRAAELMDAGEQVDLIIGSDQVDIDEVLNLVYELAGAGFYIDLVTFDNFQSAHSRQQLEKRGFKTDLLSVDKDTGAYDTLKTLARTDSLESCPNEIVLKECRRLELKKGKKVDHPPNASKDVADAAAGACKSIVELFNEEAEVEETIVDDSIRVNITPQI